MLGDRLGDWIIDKELGRGGMGHVYLAHLADDAPPSNLPRRAALKVMAPELAVEVGFLRRFQSEIKALAELSHPNIVRLYESGADGNRYYYAMEYVEGSNYEELLSDYGRIAWSEVLDMALQICSALKHAHDRGIIHRDLKPPNLLRDRTGQVKLTDFGIARVFADPHLTKTGGVVGTPEFLSPEQAMGKPATKRSDLYSFGAVLYTLLTGRTPFQGKSVLDLLHKHRYAQFDAPRTIVPDIPLDLDEIVCQLLAKDPADRPGDAMALHKQLDRIRRKYDRKNQATEVEIPAGATMADNAAAIPGRAREPGPATLMSKLMRQELERHKSGGPIFRAINRPWVLLGLLAATGCVLTWAFWPLNQDALFREGAALMASKEPTDWDRAWRDYLKPLQDKYPNSPYRDQIDEFDQKIKDYNAQIEAKRRARTAAALSEAQWFYQEGVRLRQRGDEDGALRLWHNVVRSFGDVDGERKWVDLAQAELKAPRTHPVAAERRWSAVRAALQLARKLRDDGRRAEAEEIWNGLEELYREDTSAAEIVKELRKDRGS
jgi:serine/threonine protein kinase